MAWDISVHHLRTPVVQLPCDWHVVVGALTVNILIACLKSLPQRIQTPGSLSTRWPLLWQRGDLNWREKPGKTTRTILFSRKSKGHLSLFRYISTCIGFTNVFVFNCYLSGFYLIRAVWSISTTKTELQK